MSHNHKCEVKKIGIKESLSGQAGFISCLIWDTFF